VALHMRVRDSKMRARNMHAVVPKFHRSRDTWGKSGLRTQACAGALFRRSATGGRWVLSP